MVCPPSCAGTNPFVTVTYSYTVDTVDPSRRPRQEVQAGWSERPAIGSIRRRARAQKPARRPALVARHRSRQVRLYLGARAA